MNSRADKTVDFASLLQGFFADYLRQQRDVSPHTVAAYRDTFRLVLRYARDNLCCPPSRLTFDVLSAENILSFLNYLEKDRNNCRRTRNVRLAALRSFSRYALDRVGPEFLPEAQRILAIPFKRYRHRLLGFLSSEEIDTILKVTPQTWSGRRDRLLFTMLYNTGARVSEITSIRVIDVAGSNLNHVELHGKGRKHRTVPLWPKTRRLIRQWIKENRLSNQSPLLPNRFGRALTSSGVQHRLRQLVNKAVLTCPSLKNRTISPHTFRHSTAMHMLQSGVLPEVISLWLGHESPNTTHLYIEADIVMKEKALQKLNPPKTPHRRFRANDKLLRFLDNL